MSDGRVRERIGGKDMVLSLLRDSRARGGRIRLRMEGRPLEFGTEILEVDAGGEGSLLVDSLVPKEGNRLIERAGRVLLRFDVEGIPHEAGCRFLRLEGGKFRAIRLTLPEEVERLQRRAYFRVEFSPVRPIVAIVTPQEEARRAYEVRLLNVSAGGASFSLDGFPEELRLNQRLPSIRFDLPGARRVEVAARVRSLKEEADALGRKRKVCGVEFVDVDPAVRERIYRTILAMQRETIRHRT